MRGQDSARDGNMNVMVENVDFQSQHEEDSEKHFTFEESTVEFRNIPNSHRMFKFNFHRTNYHMLGTIAIVLIFGIVSIAFHIIKRGEVDRSALERPNLFRSIVISSGKSLWNYDFDMKKYTHLDEADSSINTFDTFMDQTIFWSENDTQIIRSMERSFPNTTHTRKWKPQAIAVDYVTKKFYLIDKLSRTLNVIDIRSQMYAVMLSDLENPHDIVLDPIEGLMFILQLSQSVVRANMDGTAQKKIIQNPKISALALDRKSTKIYWANDETSIETADYDGNNRMSVTSIPMGVLSMIVFDDHLYWTRSSSYSDVCPCSNILWACQMHRRTCKNITSLKMPFSNPQIVRTSFDQQHHAPHNPCEVNNGGCQHLCLLTARGSHACACKIGWKLDVDKKTCANVTDVMLYIQGNFVRVKDIYEPEESFTDAVVPTQFYTENLDKKPLIHFEYDMLEGKFFFSDDSSIYRINLMTDEEQQKILTVSDDYKIRDLAYDWSKSNMYFVKESQSPQKNHTIEMLSIVNSGRILRKVVVSFKYTKEHYINCPFNLLINPNHEYLFFSDFNGVSDNIRRIGTNGKGLSLVKLLGMNRMVNAMAISLEKSRLYWILSNEPTILESCNLEGTEQDGLAIQIMTDSIIFVGVFGDRTFIGNLTEIWKIEDHSGSAVKLVGKSHVNNFPEMIHGFRIYSSHARKIDSTYE